jgi:hypothetical protein
MLTEKPKFDQKHRKEGGGEKGEGKKRTDTVIRSQSTSGLQRQYFIAISQASEVNSTEMLLPKRQVSAAQFRPHLSLVQVPGNCELAKPEQDIEMLNFTLQSKGKRSVEINLKANPFLW